MSADAPAPATLVYSPTPTPTEPAMAVMSAPEAVTGYNRTISYAYDSLYRLTGATYTEGATVNEYAYGYDLRGNRTSVTAPGVGTFTYSYNLANQITNQGFSYDPNGNLIHDGSLAYQYDAANRLSKVSRGTETLEYAYTGNGDRYAHTLTHGTEITSVNYLLDPSGALSRVLSENIDAPTADWINTYLYGLGILGQQNGSTWSTFGTDPLGSVRFLLDNTGEIASRADYDPYGVPLPVPGQESGMDTTLGFTGEQTDPFGLVNLRARTYNPRLGAFTSVDPVEGILSRSASRNGYSYVEGNPTNLVDPSGEFAFIPLLIAIGLGGLVGGTIYGTTQLGDLGKGLHDWGGIGAVGALAVGAPIAALVTAPVAALIGGATNVIAGAATGSYSNHNGFGAALLDAYMGTVFGGIAGNFLGSVKYFAGSRTNWFSRALGYGAINATQGVLRKWAGSTLLGESHKTNEVIRDGAIDLAVGFVGARVLDWLSASNVSGLYLRSAQPGAYNQQFRKFADSVIGQGVGIIAASNITRPFVADFANRFFIEPVGNTPSSKLKQGLSMMPYWDGIRYAQSKFDLRADFFQRPDATDSLGSLSRNGGIPAYFNTDFWAKW